MVVHSHQNTEGLHYALKNASNIYLTYSNNSKYFLKSIANGKYLNFFCRHWKEGIANKHICFINTYHSVIVSFIDKLLFKTLKSPVEMGDMSDTDINCLGNIEEKRWIIKELSGNHDNDSLPQALSNENDLVNHFYKELSETYSKNQFPKMFKITRCLLKKGVVNADERVLETVNLMDFLAFTQRFAIKQSESECESADSDSQYRSFGFCERGNEKNRKKSSRSKKDKKMWKKLCQKLIEHGVKIPLTLLKNPVAKKYFR